MRIRATRCTRHTIGDTSESENQTRWAEAATLLVRHASSDFKSNVVVVQTIRLRTPLTRRRHHETQAHGFPLFHSRWAVAACRIRLAAGPIRAVVERRSRRTEPRQGAPGFRATLAEGLALSGDLDGGLSLIEESLPQIARPGWEERSHLAEVLRLKGLVVQQQGKLAARKKTTSPHSTSHVNSRRSPGNCALQGKRNEALDLLKPVYD
jgi:hypothetical protein